MRFVVGFPTTRNLKQGGVSPLCPGEQVSIMGPKSPHLSKTNRFRARAPRPIIDPPLTFGQKRWRKSLRIGSSPEPIGEDGNFRDTHRRQLISISDLEFPNLVNFAGPTISRARWPINAATSIPRLRSLVGATLPRRRKFFRLSARRGHSGN